MTVLLKILNNTDSDFDMKTDTAWFLLISLKQANALENSRRRGQSFRLNFLSVLILRIEQLISSGITLSIDHNVYALVDTPPTYFQFYLEFLKSLL